MGVGDGGLKALTEVEIRTMAYLLGGIWSEALLYGAYLCLFLSSSKILARRSAMRTAASKLFFLGVVCMFILISLHNALNVYRLLNAFAYQAGPRDALRCLAQYNRWDNYSLSILLALIFWMGDIMVISRCYIIWGRSFWIVLVPFLLFLTSAASHSSNFWSALHYGGRANVPARLLPFLNMAFPLYVAQNVVTTALVTLKIWSRYWQSKKAGIVPLNTPNLVLVMRIVIESAAIYTTQMLIWFAFHVTNHPAKWFVLYLLAPSTGIAFVLLVVRVHSASEEANISLASPSFIHFHAGDSDLESEETCESMPGA